MFYKFENDRWWTGTVIAISPTCTIDENNRENEYGWEWHDTPPQEYLEWIEENANRLIEGIKI